jgi:predicted O-methyltransferase YrrM
MANQTLTLSNELYDYLLSINPEENSVLMALRKATYKLERHQMMSAPEQISFITFLIKLLKPKNILEIGTFTGYCTLAMALSSLPDTKIVTCDIDRSWAKIGEEFWQQANVDYKIDLHLGMAIDTLKELSNNDSKFDFVFIDADKVNYLEYFKYSLKMLNNNGVILVDNVFWGGKTADPKSNDFQTTAIRQFNQHVSSSDGINYSVIPIADGLTLVSKQ